MGNLILDYKNALKGAHKNVRLFFIAGFLTAISQGFFGILYNLYIKSLGLSDTVAGTYVSAGAIAGAISLVPAGILSDRFGRKNAIVTAGVLNALVSIAQAFVHTPILIIVGAFISGSIGSVIWVSVLPMLAENTEKDERFHLFSVNFGITLVAQVLGNFLAGSVSDMLAKHGLGAVWSLRATLLIGSFLTLCAMVPYSKIKSARKPSALQKSKPSLRVIVNQLRGRKLQLGLIAKFTVCSAIIGFGAGLVIPYLNLYFAERFHMANSGIGLVMALGQGLTAIAMFVGPAVAKRFGPVKSVVLFQLTSIPFLLMTGWMMNLWLASGAVVIRQALMNCSSPIQDSIMMALVDDDLKGFAVSCGQTMFTLGWAVMGPVSTSIVGTYGAFTGYAIVFSVTAVLYLVGSTFYFLSFGRHERAVYSAPSEAISG